MSNAGGGTGRGPRLPRWTRQEILVLIEGKRVVERSGRGRGRGGGSEGGAAAEPTKWAAVAEYCRRHGVDRGPVQCRKRWSNLAGDYKKIKEWERSCGSVPGKEMSFWAMRNNARRERRLPGFFDREVYDILEGRGAGCRGTSGNGAAARLDLEHVEGKEKEKTVIDSGRGAAAGECGLFSSSEEGDDDEDEAATPGPTPTLPPAPAPAPAPAVVAVPISEKKTEVPRQESSEQGTSKGKQPKQTTEDSPVQGGQKRQRSSDDTSGGTTADLQGQLIEILDRSSHMVAAQLEAQNINSQLDREQRKDQVSSLLGVLGKVADALYRIADKL
ncbi:trihelix transcription factor ASR3-like isoform X2 [Phragmites australis]|uniref:trihelix transcription factor ASR3-like isoform X2 n=1 Tax=Phragmites australis TaxID=29695 RepID=UPI002D78B9A7|nr:trihelix transcription factor ASR3-like isoform X2 [Phragmites australis]